MDRTDNILNEIKLNRNVTLICTFAILVPIDFASIFILMALVENGMIDFYFARDYSILLIFVSIMIWGVAVGLSIRETSETADEDAENQELE